jgi:Right handed beta helix region
MFSLVFLLVSTTYALDVTVGKTDCVGCLNYFKAGADAFPAVQAACEAVRKAGGGKVQVQAGEYIMSKNFQVFSNTHFAGAGMGLTTFKLVNRALPWKVGTSLNSGFLRAVYKSYNSCINVKISALTLDGNKVNQNTDSDSEYGRYGLFTEGCTNVYVDSVTIKNFQGYGFDPHGWKTAPGGPLYGKDLTIVNCISHDNDWDGFTLDQTDGMFVQNCFAYNNGRHGFNIVTGSRNVIIDTVRTHYNGHYYYTGAFGCGMTIQNNQNYGTHSVTVKNSLFEADKKGGVCTNDVFNIIIDNNNIKTQRPCISLVDTRDVSVTNNVCNNTNIIQKSNVINLTETNNKYVSSNVLTPTPSTCSSGNKNDEVCCLATCVNSLGQPQCGGTGCGKLPGGASNCCSTQIIASARKCSDFPPPCIL